MSALRTTWRTEDDPMPGQALRPGRVHVVRPEDVSITLARSARSTSGTTLTAMVSAGSSR